MSSRLNQKTPKQKTRLRSGAAMIELALFLTVFFIITMGTIETSIVDPTLIATLAASQNIEIHTITFSAEADQTACKRSLKLVAVSTTIPRVDPN